MVRLFQASKKTPSGEVELGEPVQYQDAAERRCYDDAKATGTAMVAEGPEFLYGINVYHDDQLISREIIDPR